MSGKAKLKFLQKKVDFFTGILLKLLLDTGHRDYLHKQLSITLIEIIGRETQNFE